MGLNPKQLDSLPDALVEIYSQVEETILQDMARRLKAYDYFIPSAQHQMQKLEELGAMRSDIIARLSALTGRTRREIETMLSQAGGQVIKSDVDYYTAADVYKPDKADAAALYKTLNAGLKQTEQQFRNITRTTANTATRQFERALDVAWTQISTGTMDYNTAIRNAIKALAAQGVQSVTYPSGRTESLETSVRRAVLTGANQTTMRTSLELAKQLGLTLVEVDAHSGARPEHAKWQGGCYSINGRQEIDGVVYEDLRKATGYGTGAGLGGWNCHHSFAPYVHGAPRTYTPEMLERYNARNIEYNGKMYTEYEASQIQRGYERSIRRWKRENAAMSAAGLDATDSAVRLRSTQAWLRDFLKQTGLKRQSDREQIAGWSYSDAARAAQAAKKYEKELENQRKRDILITKIKETKALPQSAKVNIPSVSIDTDSLEFDDNHINRERKHSVTKKDAVSYIKNAVMSATVWNGQFERYYSVDGAAYVDVGKKLIRTAYSAREYDEAVNKLMEVWKQSGD